MLVLGLDPGLKSTGWAVVNSKGRMSLVDFGVINSPSSVDLNKKIFSIYSDLNVVLKSFNVLVASIENVFVNSNAKASMYLCYARCASILALMSNNALIHEYAPTTIKKRVFGNGHASKDQVEFVIRSSLGLGSDVTFSSHTSDAIAAALCHIFTSRLSYN